MISCPLRLTRLGLSFLPRPRGRLGSRWRRPCSLSCHRPTASQEEEGGEGAGHGPRAGTRFSRKICQAPLSSQGAPATAAQRLPACPWSSPVRALPAGDSRIHWGLIRPYDAHAEFGEHASRTRDQAFRHNSVANSVWERAEACNRSREQEPSAPSASYPRPHQRSESFDRPRSWIYDSALAVRPSPSHDSTAQTCAARYSLDHPTRDSLYEAQRL